MRFNRLSEIIGRFCLIYRSREKHQWCPFDKKNLFLWLN